MSKLVQATSALRPTFRHLESPSSASKPAVRSSGKKLDGRVTIVLENEDEVSADGRRSHP